MKFFIAIAALVAVAVCATELKQPNVYSGVFCAICQDLVQDVETNGENDVENYLNGKINELCDKASIFKSMCIDAFKDVEKELIDEINAKASPQACCAKIGLC